MSYPVNYPTPQGANIQILYKTEDWVKPQGASFVWFTLIGAGGGGSAGATSIASPQAGGAGAVTHFMCPAFLIPDVLRVVVGLGGARSGLNGANGGDTSVVYQQKTTTGYSLLTAGGGVGGVANSGGQASSGTAMTANYFTAMGFFQSTSSNAVGSTFLTGGATGASITANYGYSRTGSGRAGHFQLQPIIVGVGGLGSTSSPTLGGKGGIGCGGGGGPVDSTAIDGGDGGDGLAVIITW